jgi:hypothetical protein
LKFGAFSVSARIALRPLWQGTRRFWKRLKCKFFPPKLYSEWILRVLEVAEIKTTSTCRLGMRRGIE